MVALYTSANHTYYMYEVLARRGITATVVSIPGHIAKGNCNTALEFSPSNRDIVIKLSRDNHCPVQQMYRIDKGKYIEA
ncbi:MAG: DUF3343 domain-containing protein [Clostridia bacterium]|nr:DUF3343 domain-containing protein [Clostridia bacterium]